MVTVAASMPDAAAAAAVLSKPTDGEAPLPSASASTGTAGTSSAGTAEEQRLRDRLRAKREEERLRDLIKAKSRDRRQKQPRLSNSSDDHSKGGRGGGGGEATNWDEAKMKDSSATATTQNVDAKTNGGEHSTIGGGSSKKERREREDDVRTRETQRDRRHHRQEQHPHPHHHRSSPPSSNPRHRHPHPRRSSGSPTRSRDHNQGRHQHQNHHRRRRGGGPTRGRDAPAAPRHQSHRPVNSYHPQPPGASASPRGGGRRAFSPPDDGSHAIDPFGRRQRRTSANGTGGGGAAAAVHRRSSPSRSRSRTRSPSPDAKRGRWTASSRSPSVSSYSSSGASSRSSSSSGSGSSNSNSSASGNSYSSASSRSSVPPADEPAADDDDDANACSKDQRTVFVTQLVLRTTGRDLAKFFRAHKLRTNEIILLRDKRTGKHKGSAYVELRRLADVATAVNLSGLAPDFQRFPILIKASEAERNYVPAVAAAAATAATPGGVAASFAVAHHTLPHAPLPPPPLRDVHGRLVQAQKVYVGNLEANLVTAQHLQVLFAPFGTLTEIQLQAGKGFAFLQFHDPKEAALAIQTMTGQVLAGRPIKTGWATNQVTVNGAVEIVTATEFPPDAATRAQNAYHVLAQLTTGAPAAATTATPPSVPAATMSAVAASSSSRVPTVADARASLAAAAAAAAAGGATPANTAMFAMPAASLAFSAATTTAAIDPAVIGNAEHPTRHVLVHNMFDKDQETEVGWESEIRQEFTEECGQYGTIVTVTVMHKEPGGKIYASFDGLTGAKTCALSLAGRWFDKRQLRVEFVSDERAERVRHESSLP